MRFVRATSASLLLAATAAGCFSEAPIDDGPSVTSDSGGCAAGGLGCECYGNGTCDPSLECAPQTNSCVPADCELGHVHCLCDNESCVEPLLCVAGICAAPSDSSGVESSSGMPADTSAGEVTATTSDPDTSGSVGPTTSEPTSDTSSSDESTGEPPVVCEDLDMCADCAECIAEPEQFCAPQADACGGTEGCNAAAACMMTCGTGGLCLDNCCEGLDAATVALALALNDCRADQCAAGPCNDYQDPVCF